MEFTTLSACELIYNVHVVSMEIIVKIISNTLVFGTLPSLSTSLVSEYEPLHNYQEGMCLQTHKWILSHHWEAVCYLLALLAGTMRQII